LWKIFRNAMCVCTLSNYAFCYKNYSSTEKSCNIKQVRISVIMVLNCVKEKFTSAGGYCFATSVSHLLTSSLSSTAERKVQRGYPTACRLQLISAQHTMVHIPPRDAKCAVCVPKRLSMKLSASL